MREEEPMMYSAFHSSKLRLLACVAGEFITALGLNLFLVPSDLYTGGIMGVCQLVRTLLQMLLGISFGSHDIAGILYFLVNIPILLWGYMALGRAFVGKTLFCVAVYSFFCSAIPIPSVPIISDPLTNALLSGVVCGAGCGIVLTCGGSSGGLEIVGLCMSKRGSPITIGKLATVFNVALYAVYMFLFSPAVTIYSIIYSFACNTMLDRSHQQVVNVQALIFTRESSGRLEQYIMETLHRGVTYWEGTGAYTKEGVRVLSVCLSKYEIEQLLHAVHGIDPKAFITTQEGVRVYGNFQRNL